MTALAARPACLQVGAEAELDDGTSLDPSSPRQRQLYMDGCVAEGPSCSPKQMIVLLGQHADSPTLSRHCRNLTGGVLGRDGNVLLPLCPVCLVPVAVFLHRMLYYP